MKLKENSRNVLLVILLAVLLGLTGYWNYWYKTQTPPEVLEMAEQIKTLKHGDFLIQNDERAWIVDIGVQNYGGHQLLVRSALGELGHNAYPVTLARTTHHIVRQDDPEWGSVARRFLCDTGDIAQVDSSN